jgi:hypothetical protein
MPTTMLVAAPLLRGIGSLDDLLAEDAWREPGYLSAVRRQVEIGLLRFSNTAASPWLKRIAVATLSVREKGPGKGRSTPVACQQGGLPWQQRSPK